MGNLLPTLRTSTAQPVPKTAQAATKEMVCKDCNGKAKTCDYCRKYADPYIDFQFTFPFFGKVSFMVGDGPSTRFDVHTTLLVRYCSAFAGISNENGNYGPIVLPTIDPQGFYQMALWMYKMESTDHDDPSFDGLTFPEIINMAVAAMRLGAVFTMNACIIAAHHAASKTSSCANMKDVLHVYQNTFTDHPLRKFVIAIFNQRGDFNASCLEDKYLSSTIYRDLFAFSRTLYALQMTKSWDKNGLHLNAQWENHNKNGHCLPRSEAGEDLNAKKICYLPSMVLVYDKGMYKPEDQFMGTEKTGQEDSNSVVRQL